MASSKEFLEYILEQLSEVEEITVQGDDGGSTLFTTKAELPAEYMMTDCL
jgi:hypothetical protein